MRKSALLLILILICTDGVLKFFVNKNIPHMSFAYPHYPYGGYGIFRDLGGIDFALVHVTNKGAAWGVLAKFQGALTLFRLGFVVFLVSYIFWFKNSGLSLYLIVAGAIANLVDTFVYGHVIDMFYFNFWGYSYPVFNLADSFIFLGVVSLFTAPLFKGGVKKVAKKRP